MQFSDLEIVTSYVSLLNFLSLEIFILLYELQCKHHKGKNWLSWPEALAIGGSDVDIKMV